ncbi:MAG: hypothetical protein BroJett020_02080 [Bacteroidota bacterium]|nr:MAG: hypothetical protein BroJett020_02080 [Bacteroidota bacterium]
MKSILSLQRLTVLTVLILTGCKTYKLPDAKMKPEQVCGYNYCQPGNYGVVFHFYKKPFSPDVDSMTTLRDVAYSIIGHAFPNGNLLGDRAFTCSRTTSNPFTASDIVNLVNPTGKDINYTRKEKLQIDINAVVEGNIEEIKRLNPSITNVPEIEARLKAAYSKINNKELTVQAKYSEWGLSRTAIEKLVKEDGYTDCKEFLIEKNYRIITAVGIISFDITFDDKSVDQISSELDAEMKQYGITANLAISFKKEVTQSLKTSTRGGFQIVVWRSVAGNELMLKK